MEDVEELFGEIQANYRRKPTITKKVWSNEGEN